MPDLRPMLPGDVDAATEMILSHEWGVRREWLALAVSLDACIPLVAEVDGEIVGTGVGTVSGAAGWIGTIFLAPAWRGQGLGRAITQALIERLQSAGCRTLVLVATAEGRRLYERMGFEVATRYRILEAPGLADDEPRLANVGRDVADAGRDVADAGRAEPDAGRADPDDQDARRPAVRPYGAADLEAVLALDREGTGEDRAAVIRRLATPASARVLDGGVNGVDGFVIRAPWGGGATVARSVEAALAIATARRLTAGPTGRVRVGLLAENEAGLARLRDEGFVDQWSAPRMVRGEPLDWHPDWIWGQFNHAIG